VSKFTDKSINILITSSPSPSNSPHQQINSAQYFLTEKHGETWLIFLLSFNDVCLLYFPFGPVHMSMQTWKSHVTWSERRRGRLPSDTLWVNGIFVCGYMSNGNACFQSMPTKVQLKTGVLGEWLAGREFVQEFFGYVENRHYLCLHLSCFPLSPLEFSWGSENSLGRKNTNYSVNNFVQLSKVVLDKKVTSTERKVAILIYHQC
jgi:hypothetical protein